MFQSDVSHHIRTFAAEVYKVDGSGFKEIQFFTRKTLKDPVCALTLVTVATVVEFFFRKRCQMFARLKIELKLAPQGSCTFIFVARQISDPLNGQRSCGKGEKLCVYIFALNSVIAWKTKTRKNPT